MHGGIPPDPPALVAEADLRESFSITVYGGVLDRVARSVQDFLGLRWRTTRLDDRRHKRR